MSKPSFIGLVNMSKQVKKQQYIFLGVLIATLLLIFAVFFVIGSYHQKKKVEDKAHYTKHTIASPLSANANEMHWIEKTQNAWKAENEKSQKLEANIQNLDKERKSQGKVINSQSSEISEMRSMLSSLQQELATLRKNEAHPETTPDNPNSDFVENNNGLGVSQGFIQYAAKLNKKREPRVRTPENYVFSNTFAKAKVLGGADAPAGVLSSSDPEIMKFEIIDDGIMPNSYRAKLKGCFFSASVVGDISSERGKLRTERLSCIHRDGTSLDIQITGTVSDSKNGIRGQVVWRDEPIVARAFWGNLWGSLGNIGQQYSQEYSVSPLGNTSTLQTNKIPLAAGSSAASGASQTYAKYNIKRAELYHPIIQLAPGTVVDVTFLKGFWLDGGSDDKAPETLNEKEDMASHNSDIPDSAEGREANKFFYDKHSY